MSKNPSELDPNFRAAEVEEGTRWLDAGTLIVEGQGWRSESAPYGRLPARAEAIVREPVWLLGRCSAGVCVRFTTDATSIAARWSVVNEIAMNHMPATGVSGLDLYIRDAGRWRWAGVGRPNRQGDNEAVLLTGAEPARRECRLYLPLYNETTVLKIGVPVEAKIEPGPGATGKPIVFYGTSIVQGGCAARAGMGYPEILSRRLDCEHINLGFSGNGRAEPEVAELLAELDPAIYVIDCLPNLSEPDITARVGPLLKTVRAARPATPIVAVENITYQGGWINAATRQRQETSNAALRAIVGNLWAEGMPHLYYLPGDGLLGDDGEGTVDGSHPTDVGFQRMATALEPLLRKLL